MSTGWEGGDLSAGDRSAHDVDRARELGEKYGRALNSFPLTLKYWRPAMRSFRGTGQVSFARALLGDLVSDIDAGEVYPDTRDQVGRPFPSTLAVSTRVELTNYLEGALRLLAFSREAKLDGVPVAVANSEGLLQNGLGASPLFDIFNPRARRIFAHGEDDRWDRVPPGYNDLRDWALRTVESDSRVTLVPQRVAATGFMTLFTDSVRSVVRWVRDINTSYVHYTFQSRRPGGLQVQYHPQYFTSPVVFGDTLSTPVEQRVLIGHYHFLGQPEDGPPIRDSAVFFASPDTRVGNTVIF